MVECLAAGFGPLTALTFPFVLENGPWTVSIEIDGKLVGMAGLTPDRDHAAALIWLLGSPELDRAGKSLCAFGRAWLPRALGEFPSLYNVVPAANEATIRWLRWLGFDFDPEFVHFHEVRFLRFRMNRQDGPNSAPAPE